VHRHWLVEEQTGVGFACFGFCRRKVFYWGCGTIRVVPCLMYNSSRFRRLFVFWSSHLFRLCPVSDFLTNSSRFCHNSMFWCIFSRSDSVIIFPQFSKKFELRQTQLEFWLVFFPNFSIFVSSIFWNLFKFRVAAAASGPKSRLATTTSLKRSIESS